MYIIMGTLTLLASVPVYIKMSREKEEGKIEYDLISVSLNENDN